MRFLVHLIRSKLGLGVSTPSHPRDAIPVTSISGETKTTYEVACIHCGRTGVLLKTGHALVFYRRVPMDEIYVTCAKCDAQYALYFDISKMRHPRTGELYADWTAELYFKEFDLYYRRKKRQ